MTQDQKNKLIQLLGTIEGVLVDLEEISTTLEDLIND